MLVRHQYAVSDVAIDIAIDILADIAIDILADIAVDIGPDVAFEPGRTPQHRGHHDR